MWPPLSRVKALPSNDRALEQYQAPAIAGVQKTEAYNISTKAFPFLCRPFFACLRIFPLQAQTGLG